MSEREREQPGTFPVARLHHYVPEFYLAGFTSTGSREDFLWIHDLEQKRGWRQRPREVACERDFYRVDADDLAPDAVEKDPARFEELCSQALAQVVRERALPTGETLARLVGFATLLVVRTPSFREIFLQNARDLLRHSTRVAIAHPEAFQAFQEHLARQGEPLPPGVTQQSMLEFLDDSSLYTIEIPQLWTLGNIFDMFRALYPQLARRTWSLVEATEGEFICSDNPVSLVATSPEVLPHFGFGLRETEVSFPLNRSLALIGSFDSEPKTSRALTPQVGFLNRRTLASARRFAHSASEEYVIAFPAGVEPRARP